MEKYIYSGFGYSNRLTCNLLQPFNLRRKYIVEALHESLDNDLVGVKQCWKLLSLEIKIKSNSKTSNNKNKQQ